MGYNPWCRMRLTHRNLLEEFWQVHPDVEGPLKAWLREARSASWKSFLDVKKRYASADVLKGNRVVFNIKGNHYRLVVQVNYAVGHVDIRFIGAHSEYDRIDAERI